MGSGAGIPSGEGSGTGGSGGYGSGSNRGKPYTKDESIAVAKAWDAITSDPVVGTDQAEGSFWRRVMFAYEEFKPDGAERRDPEQLRKKWGRILHATKRFASIYENNLRHAESGRSATDVKNLSDGQYHTEGWPKFTLWEEYLVLADCPKFRSIVANEVGTAPGPKRTRHNLVGDYSSGSGSQEFEQSDEQVEEPADTHTRRRRPMGQHASIRSARGGRRASRLSAGASGSRIHQPAPIP
ncbi:glutathione S-transferase T3-like [Salvia splendens]|uniref:glutathione S-transferase T3-like n=1 Tax=Salvia splendens TaxID=180675 RepID=UPI001C2756EE|nr:glutathione S-transferase T3-like [Salvia splendens]